MVSFIRPPADDRLQMLSELLKTAFRLHCTGESLDGRGPWEVVCEVQGRLAALSGAAAGPVSEDRLLCFLEAPPARVAPRAAA
jgi:hypothetical protein